MMLTAVQIGVCVLSSACLMLQAERDLAETPAVLHALTASWQDPTSFNCQTAKWVFPLSMGHLCPT